MTSSCEIRPTRRSSSMRSCSLITSRRCSISVSCSLSFFQPSSLVRDSSMSFRVVSSMSSRIFAVSSTARAAWRSRAAMFSASSPISARWRLSSLRCLLQLVAQLVGDAIVRGDLILAILDLRA